MTPEFHAPSSARFRQAHPRTARETRGRVVWCSAFTVLEMMVSVTLLVVIIFSLYKMFDQTQRAFRGGVKLVDVMEGGRAATEFIARDLRLASGSRIPGYTNVYIRTNPAASTLFVTNFPDSTVFDLILQEVFFVTPEGRDWKGLGYFVAENTANNQVDLTLLAAGVGSLYRFAMPTNALLGQELLYNFTNVVTSNTTQLARVLDGVVGFRVRALDAAGDLLTNSVPYPFEPLVSFRSVGNDLPAYFDVELHVLNADSLEPIKARIAPLVPSPAAVQMAQELLSQHAPHIQVYRQMIAVPGAQP